MSNRELMQRHKTRSEVSDLTAEELEIYKAYLALGETVADEEILSRAWLRLHREMQRVI